MKKLLILLFSILISFNSYGEWKHISTNVVGDNFYIEVDTIWERDGYIYFTFMTDFLKPTEGMMSNQIYTQVDCEILRSKFLTFTSYEQSMGKSKMHTMTLPEQWRYPTPENVFYELIYYICN